MLYSGSQQCVQVYRIEYPGEILVVFDLQLESGTYTSVPDFYLVTVTDVNGRTTFEVNGTSTLAVACLMILSFTLQCCHSNE